VQCAGNMRMYDPVYLEMLRDACNRYEVHLIADEIAVGFGAPPARCFACEQARHQSRFHVSVERTHGGLPAAVGGFLTTESVYAAFYDEYTKLNAFSTLRHSFTGNPLALRGWRWRACGSSGRTTFSRVTGHSRHTWVARGTRAREPIHTSPRSGNEG